MKEVKSFAEVETEERRLTLLQALQHAAQYTANAALLRRYCSAVGLAASGDRLEADIAWLAEQGLVERRHVQAATVATLTARGLDVATGAATVPGVQRPRPE